MEHFLIATTMLAVGLFAVLSWESTFPDRRDVLVLGPLPVRARTLFLAKIAAVGTALGLTIASLHALAGLAWPLALAQFDSIPAPALVFDPALPPVRAADFPAVMNRDIAPILRRLDLAAADGGAGIVIGISDHGDAPYHGLRRGETGFPFRNRLHHQNVHRPAVGANGGAKRSST